MPAVLPPEPPLSDGVVAVRGWLFGDAAAVAAACQDPEISRWTFVPSPYTEADARAFVAGARARYAAGIGAPLAIVDPADGRLLGATGLNVIDWGRRAADVGYWVDAPARGRGVATRAVELVAQWSFWVLGLEHLDLRPHRDNIASQRVARGAGFEPADVAVTRRDETDGPEMLVFARRRTGSPDGRGR